MSKSLDRFIELLLRSELITESQLSHVRELLDSTDPESADDELVRQLADSGQLTDFQVAEMQQGNLDNLVIGDYLLLNPVGQGGMGRVFKARHSVMKREVAVKFVLPEEAGRQSGSSSDRFEREVEAASQLSHPNIVSSLDAGRHGETCYLVMELVRGMNLSDHLRHYGPMPIWQAYDCVVQTANGLQYAHRKGVVHRDIKPSNLLLTDDGQIKILDMGLVRMRIYENEAGDSSEVDDPLTRSGQLLGTVDYMAPEQAVDPRMADERSDIYSLGCTFCSLLTGSPPFRQQGKSPMSRIIAHREVPIPRIGATRSDFPDSLEQIFRKMMAKDVRKRYQSCRDLLNDLEAARNDIQRLPGTVAETKSILGVDTRIRGRRKWTAWVPFVVLAGLFGMIGYGIYHAQPEAEENQIAVDTDNNDEAPPIEPLQPIVPTGPVDLLGDIDFEEQVVTGEGWQMIRGRLHVPASKPAKLYFPVQLTDTFHVKLRVTRSGSPGPFVFGICDDERRCFFLIDARRREPSTQLVALGTKAGRLVKQVTQRLDDNYLPDDEPIDLLVDVSWNRIVLRDQQRVILEWQGDLGELGLGAGWTIGDKNGVFLGGNDMATFEVERVEFIPWAAESIGEQPIDASSFRNS